MFAGRGQWYRNLWDSVDRAVPAAHGRRHLADAVRPGDAATSSSTRAAPTSTSGWCRRTRPGWSALMGGRAPAERPAGRLLRLRQAAHRPGRHRAHRLDHRPVRLLRQATYNPNNEPDLLAPYMYLWAGQPCEDRDRRAGRETLFTTGPDGMTGNDDLGTMSAWYVFSSLGLYPTMSGANFLGVVQPAVPVGDGPDRRLRRAGRHADDHRARARATATATSGRRRWTAGSSAARSCASTRSSAAGGSSYALGTQP